MTLTVTSPPSACERCNKELPGPDPLTHRTLGKHHRYSTECQRSPVRVVIPGPEGEPSETYFCSSRCFYVTNKKPEKKRKPGKPAPERCFSVSPQAA